MPTVLPSIFTPFFLHSTSVSFILTVIALFHSCYFHPRVFGNTPVHELLEIVSKQLTLLRGRVGDSTAAVGSMRPTMRKLIQDIVVSYRDNIVEHFGLIGMSSRNLWILSDIQVTSCTSEADTKLLHFLELIVLGFCLLGTIEPLCPSQCLFGTIMVTLCLMMWDWPVLRAEPKLFCWPNLLFLSIEYYFLFFILPRVACLGLGS